MSESQIQKAFREACRDLGTVSVVLGFKEYPGIDPLLCVIIDLLAAAPKAANQAAQKPYLYVYEFDTPLGVHREMQYGTYNGRWPDRTVALYTEPQAVSDAAARTQRSGDARTEPSDTEIDKHLDAVLRAAGSSLKHFTLPKYLADMRQAMREATAAKECQS